MEGLVVLVLLALAAIPVILPIVSLVVASRTRARLQALEDATARLQDELNALAARVQRGRTAPVVTPEEVEIETGTSRAQAPAARPRRPLPCRRAAGCPRPLTRPSRR
jgi:hypothetical protein